MQLTHYRSHLTRVILIISLILVTSSYAEERKIIQFWHSNNSELFWQSIIDDFNQTHSNIKIQISVFPTEELKTAIVKAVYSKQAPEVVMFSSDNLGYRDLFELSVVSEDILSPQLTASSLEYVKNQELLGIPLYTGNHLVLFYNKSYINQPASNWQELLKQTPKLLQQNIKPLAIKYSEMYWFIAFLHGMGGETLKLDKPTLNTAEMVNTLKFYKQLQQTLKVPQSCTYDCPSLHFFQGKYAYSINGDWEFEQTRKRLGNNFGIAPLPTIHQHKVSSLSGALTIAFPAQSLSNTNRPHLVELAKYLQSEKVMRRISTELHVFPSHKLIQAEILNEADENWKALISQLEVSKKLKPSKAVVSSWNAMAKGLNLYLNGTLSAHQTAEYMQSTAEYEMQKLTNTRLQ